MGLLSIPFEVVTCRCNEDCLYPHWTSSQNIVYLQENYDKDQYIQYIYANAYLYTHSVVASGICIHQYAV